MARLLPLQLDAETPVERAEAAEVGQHAVEAGELDVVISAWVSGATSRGARSSRPIARTSSSEPCMPAPGWPLGSSASPSGSTTAARTYSANGISAAAADVLAEHAEALVRVDPPAPGRRDRRLALEGQAGGVREQVPDRRTGRPRRLVEVDDALLGRDERGEGGDRLRDRREAHGAVVSPCVSTTPSARVTPTAANATSQASIWCRACTGRDTSVPPWSAG